jgi:hypothetical protein
MALHLLFRLRKKQFVYGISLERHRQRLAATSNGGGLSYLKTL